MAAGEYVLGTLDAAEMREARSRQSRDPGFASAVAFWEDRLAPLSQLVRPVAPPAALWSRLALATGVREPPAKGGRLRFWQATTAAATLLAAGLAVVAFLPRAPVPSPPDLHFAAALAPLNVSVPFLADARSDGQLVITPLGNTAVAAGRSLQLWELQAGATRPVPLALLSSSQPVVVNTGNQPWGQAQLLVSEEPAGGSKTGQPTGPVRFGGTLTPLSPPGQ